MAEFHHYCDFIILPLAKEGLLHFLYIKSHQVEYKMLNEKWPHILTEEKNAFRVRGQIVAMSTNEEKRVRRWCNSTGCRRYSVYLTAGIVSRPYRCVLSKTVKISPYQKHHA
ncbi:hypothetical protein EB796_014830 [Bugula neritina]|uniref:Uncharacterized protein n=1 Tax=Bugula neritina TaxID=10212 RepID=A0A7J7JN42_BUGNE|nr:hypothetical protein EB796_014830 [Bugula neritina]